MQRSDSQVDISTFAQGLSQVPDLQEEQEVKCFSAVLCEDISDCLFKIDAYTHCTLGRESLIVLL